MEENVKQENMKIKNGYTFISEEGTDIDRESIESGKYILTGTGRRKTATARVFLYTKKGEIFVNGVPIDEYFPTEKAKLMWMKPFHAVGVSHPEAQFSATIKTHGSGKSAQLDAVVLGFSRALAKMSEEYAASLRKQELMTRDSRMVERKKPFLRKARKRPQYSKR